MKRKLAIGASALLLLCSMLGLVACDQDATSPVAVDAGGSACYAPLACGAFYPVPVYPYYAHPYYGLLVNPAHTIVSVNAGRTVVVYRPYSTPVRPAAAYKAPAAPAAKPAAPVPKPPAPAPRPVVKAGKQ